MFWFRYIYIYIFFSSPTRLLIADFFGSKSAQRSNVVSNMEGQYIQKGNEGKMWHKIYLSQVGGPVHRGWNKSPPVLCVLLYNWDITLFYFYDKKSQSESYLLFLYEEGIQLELRGRQHLAFLRRLLRIFSMFRWSLWDRGRRCFHIEKPSADLFMLKSVHAYRLVDFCVF